MSVGNGTEVGGSARGASPLWPVLLLTWLCSLGSAIATTGVFFVAKGRFGFSATDNLWLGLVYGVTYIVGAGSSGWVVRRFAAPGRVMTPRRLLAAVMVVLAVVCWLPFVAQAPWAVWVFVAIYSPLGGWQWPLVESYVASGRSGDSLRRAIGRFNMSWASAVAIALWLMAPMVEPAPLGVVAALGILHLLCVPVVWLLRERPASHGEATVSDGIDDQNLARRLLTTFRGLLVMSFVLFSGLTPMLPDRLTALGIAATWQTPVTSVWMFSRVALFVLLERWHGWHGRWRTVVWSSISLFGGFALAMYAPNFWTLILGLALFGIGFGGCYCAALYYAMVVGSSDVDAGGKHETIIGVGYTLGPAGMLALRSMGAVNGGGGAG